MKELIFQFKFKYAAYRILSFIGMISIFVSFMVCTVSAASTVGFVNYEDYSDYRFPNNDMVIVDCSFPAVWNHGRFLALLPDKTTDVFYYSGSSFEFEAGSYTMGLVANPFSNSMNMTFGVGKTFSNGYALNIDNIPSNTILTYDWSFEISFHLEPESIVDNDSYWCNFSTFYIDSTGLVLYKQNIRVVPVITLNEDTGYKLDYLVDFQLDSAAMDDPRVVAIVPAIVSNNMTFSGTDIYPPATVTGTMGSLSLTFTLTDAYYEAQQNEKMQQTLNRIESAMEEQNQILQEGFEDLQNGTPEQNQQAEDAVGGLKDSTDELGALGDQLSSVEKPVIDSNKISADSLVPDTALVALSSPFQALWENNQLLAMLTIVVTLVLVSWVFFGKKG